MVVIQMAANNRIFIAFAVENTTLRDFLVGQARNEKSPFSFVDMSVKEPWDTDWKNRCRTKIKGCDGVIGIITKNTPSATGQLWELGCAYEEQIPVLLIHGYSDSGLRLDTDRLPVPITGRRVNNWSWPNIENFLERL